MKNNEPVYTGITKQSLEKRQNQNLIENPIGNSNKLNKINSISPKNKFHDEAIKWAQNNK